MKLYSKIFDFIFTWMIEQIYRRQECRELILKKLYEGIQEQCHEQTGAGQLLYFMDEVRNSVPGWVDDETFIEYARHGCNKENIKG